MSLRRGIGIKRGCEPCRIAHAKCDKKRPQCSRCTWLEKECIREPNYRFLNTNSTDVEVDSRGLIEDGNCCAFEYPKDQIWIRTPKEVEFILEAGNESDSQPQGSKAEGTDGSRPAHLLSPAPSRRPSTFAPTRYGDASENNTENEAAEPSHAPQDENTGFQLDLSHVEAANTLRVISNSVVLLDPSPPVSTSTNPVPVTPNSVSESPGSRRLVQSPIGQRQLSGSETRRNSLSPLYGPSRSGLRDSNPWNLTSPDEAMLMRYFVTNLSCLFDYCDPERSFSTTVVQRAVSCPTLLLAILAASALHLSLTGGYDSYLAEQYHRDCLALLIPMLNDKSTLLDEAICAATVILRYFEEISVPLVGKDTQSHLLGTHVFVRAQEYRASGIRQAAFRIALRQEITVAFSTRQPVQLLSEYVNVDRCTDLNSDWQWTFRVTVLCAEVINHCYCDDAKDFSQAWKDLSNRAQKWLQEKPASFEPLQCVDSGVDERVFPEIWFLNDCHVAGHIYYLMCHILLTAYDPARPRLGPGRAEAIRGADDVIRDDVRKICGIAISNPHVLPSMFQACAVIAMCGDLFTDRIEQQALLDLLAKTQVDFAWPTAGAQSYLKERWGWS